MRTFTDADRYRVKIEADPNDEHEFIATVRSAKGSKEFRVSQPVQVPVAIASSVRRQGLDPRDFFWAGYLVRNSARPLFDEIWARRIAAVNAAMDREKAREAAIEGLAELRAAVDDRARYRDEFNQMMEDEENDGARPPNRPRGDVAALAARYPAAALYLRAEDYELAHHWAKAKAGKEAMEIVLDGGDLVVAAAKLENWLTDNKVEVD